MLRTPLVRRSSIVLLLILLCLPGCRSPYHSDQGALTGGLLGAGTGAIIGNATGNTLAGAAIGTGVGALAGAAIGNGMDEVEAKNRAMIAQQMGRQVAAGVVRVDDVVAMHRAGVREELIANHVRANGMAAPLQPGDLIRLQQEGVTPGVVEAMQTARPPAAQPVVVQQSAPVIVEEYPYGPYCYGPRYYRPYYYRHPPPPPPPGVSLSIH